MGSGQRIPVRLYNAVQGVARRLRGPRPGFLESLDDLHETAARAVGHENFGDDSYLEGLRVLTGSYDRESKLTPFGRMMVEQQLAGILRNRLVAQKAWAEDPAILRNRIERPVFILGLPRTGTTALHFLLGQDPGTQVLEYWLAAAPVARPPRDGWEQQPRFKDARRELRTMYYLDPSLKAIHLMTADGPDECRHLFQQSLTDDTFDCNSTLPTYSRWYGQADMVATYQRHRDLLKLIGATSPEKRWVLKYPVHMGSLRTLFEVYPDACVVQTHRDPSKVMPSLCSLVAGWRAIYEEEPDRHAIADWLLELWSSRLMDAMAVRREHSSERFFDLHFHEVTDDPIDSVRRIYTHFGLELTEVAEQRLISWHSQNPRGRHGEHHYRAEDFGFSEAGMNERFAPYIEHFGVAREADGAG